MDTYGHICLTDFGKVRSAFKPEYGFHATPLYIGIGKKLIFWKKAPELLKNPENLRMSCDFWQLGIVLYEMIYSHPPFMADDNEDLFDFILNCDLVFPDHPKVSPYC